MEVIQGTCNCGEPISIELNADPKSCGRTDRKRPFYPDENVEPEGNKNQGLLPVRCIYLWGKFAFN